MSSVTATRSRHVQIAVYLGILTLTSALAAALAGLPIAFYLKDRLHVGPQGMAVFGALTGTPAYVGFAFGFLRDRWRPFGQGDRGYLLLAAPPGAAAYVWLALGHITYAGLIVGVLVTMLLAQFWGTATSALTTAVAQARGMTGRLGALSIAAGSLPVAIPPLLGGWLTSHVSPQVIFLITAGTVALLFPLGCWKPASVFDDQPDTAATGESQWQALRRLTRHRPLRPAMLIWLMWGVGLSGGTPLFFYLTDTIRLTSDEFGVYTAVSCVAFAPTAALYGALCKKWPLRRLLWWGAISGTLQFAPLLIVRSGATAIEFAMLFGLMGGFASAAFLDLLMRSCPGGLEGTGIMLSNSAAAAVAAAGNLVGTWLYMRGGFALGVWVTTGIYALIGPAILLVPASVAGIREGELTVPRGRAPAPEGGRRPQPATAPVVQRFPPTCRTAERGPAESAGEPATEVAM